MVRKELSEDCGLDVAKKHDGERVAMILRMDIPIKNDSDHEIELGLEPEGDSITMAPGDRCVVRLRDAGKPDFDLEYRGNLISLSAMCSKEVFLNGNQIR